MSASMTEVWESVSAWTVVIFSGGTDHACGDEGEVVVGIGGVNDGCESDVGGAFDDHLGDAGGNCFDELAVGPGVESFDEGDGVEELDGGNFGDWVVGLGVHGCFSGQLWGFVFR